MFLKTLRIKENSDIIRDIHFHKGLNLIVDETEVGEKKSGNNVGKTTVLRLIDYALGSRGHNIYKDTEFKSASNTSVNNFLKNKNITIELTLKENIDIPKSKEVCIERNFLQGREKIQKIDDKKYNNKDFTKKLYYLIFSLYLEKPSFREVISKNIRDEKNKLLNLVKVLHDTTTSDRYEALYLFWLGINIHNIQQKEKLKKQKKQEEEYKKRIEKEDKLSTIKQSLIVLEKEIEEKEEHRKKRLDVNPNYQQDADSLEKVRENKRKISNDRDRLALRKELILESKANLEGNTSSIDPRGVELLYKQAKKFIPDIQKSFEETLKFHNQMIKEKIEYITKELPNIENNLNNLNEELHACLSEERKYTEKLKEIEKIGNLEELLPRLYQMHERKGKLEKNKEILEKSQTLLDDIEEKLEKINKGIKAKAKDIEKKVETFNAYFSDLSEKLYGEKCVIALENINGAYEIKASSVISGNLGAGKKKGQIAAFDLAYIKYADDLRIKCLHFIVHDQIEIIDGNQINSIKKIVSEANCQYIVPVLKDKLPKGFDIETYQILSLSQDNKLFKLNGPTS